MSGTETVAKAPEASEGSWSSLHENGKLDVQDLLVRVAQGACPIRPSRRRLHLPRHVSEEDRAAEKYAKRIATPLYQALTPNATDETYKAKATAMAARLARCVAYIEGDERKHDIFVRLINALKDPKNTRLRDDIVEEHIPPMIVPQLTEDQLRNPEDRKKIAEERRKRGRERDESLMSIALVSTLYQCPECQSRRCTANERTSSDAKFWVSDDDSSAVVTCLDCHHTFKS
jgi:hypothetical protein